ncbi:GSCOCG00006482001-RA-CDS [Cotesia congregata]|uniref:Pro-corazonin n=1 Tax=Cotesia congregata TaxID=51543 RepID=A0A8J2HPW4_COTCN|nr:GSCOCG00006482001-RA-CDS [Cotesia congregata]CAG5106292.1 Similar to Crz: Pro-corazonin (Apis mellifera) [Cotesia congregata]
MLYLSWTPVILSAVIITATCQTFQYSRGWTNGKRDIAPIGFNSQDFKPDNFETNSIISNDNLHNNDGTVQCNLRKIKVLLQGDRREQIYLCRLLEILSKINKEDKLPIHYRHPIFEANDIDN